MRASKKAMSLRERELLRRCLIFGVGSVFFFCLAAVRAWSGDYYGYGQPPSATDAWDFPEEDDDDVMSADDHMMAARLRRRVVGQRPVYHKRKAGRVHDSVTIIIDEETTSEVTSSNDLKRDSSNNMLLTSWLTLGGSQRGSAAGGNTPTINYSNSRAHKSDSTIEREQAFESTLTGRVIFVQPNGHLVIEARKTLNVNGEVQTVTVTGIVNPDHMDSNSSINAEYIMDMSVSYTGKGPMTRMDKRGWASKAIDFLNPF